jgi:small nuclear ribonucleoprotein (snRNP)-like protein
MTDQFIGSWVELELQDGLRMKGIVQHIDINTKTMNMTSGK